MSPELRLAGVAAGSCDDSFVLRRAAKAHSCARRRRWDPQAGVSHVLGRHWDGGPIPDDCRGWIAPGEQYLEVRTTAVRYQAGPRYCAACAVAAGLAEFVGGPLATAGAGVEAGTTTPESRTTAPSSPPVVGGHLESVSMEPTVRSGRTEVTQLAHPMVAEMHT